MGYHEIWLASVLGLSMVYTIHSYVFIQYTLYKRMYSIYLQERAGLPTEYCILFHKRYECKCLYSFILNTQF